MTLIWTAFINQAFPVQIQLLRTKLEMILIVQAIRNKAFVVGSLETINKIAVVVPLKFTKSSYRFE